MLVDVGNKVMICVLFHHHHVFAVRFAESEHRAHAHRW